MLLYCFLFFYHQFLVTHGNKDEVTNLPGLKFHINFKHYSGYLNGSSTHMLHYWFLESQNSSSTDPLVLWLNGGPGCSSLNGLITENGPFQVTPESNLIPNPYSWNKIANIIYLESPACVGFSYSTDKKCDASDDTTSLLNLNALQHFLIKFPNYKYRDFYITGESYAGFYIPLLASKIISHTPHLSVQFKGILIGNALSSRSINLNGGFHFAYNHGLMSDAIWMQILAMCCRGKEFSHCDITGNKDPVCQEKVLQVMNSLENLNPYNIYADCYNSSTIFKNHNWSKYGIKSNYLKMLITNGWHSDSNNNLQKLHEIYKISQSEPVLPCLDDRASTNYLNKPAVRMALHIPDNVPKWLGCSEFVNKNYVKLYENMTNQYNELFQLKNFKIWIYNGDVDMVCSYLADEWFFENFHQQTISPRKPWYYKDSKELFQIGGFIKIWEKFVLITVRGSGHMVPTDKPKPAYQIFKSFLKGIMK